jgi:hypothetical protein
LVVAWVQEKCRHLESQAQLLQQAVALVVVLGIQHTKVHSRVLQDHHVKDLTVELLGAVAVQWLVEEELEK